MNRNELIENLEQLHTTHLGAVRVQRNLSLTDCDIVNWCREKIKRSNASIARKGKNWYIVTEGCQITVNAGSYTIITAHKVVK